MAKAEVIIRPMVEEDLSGVLAIDQKLFGQNRALTYSDPVQDYLGGELRLSWVAEVGDAIVGFILCQVAEPRLGLPVVAWIGSLGVDPAFRHRGIAGELVKALMKQCQSLKLKEIHIMADGRDEVLERFLKFMGFRPAELLHYMRYAEY